MRATPVNLIGGFYADDTRHWSVQDTVNWLPVMAEQGGTLTPAKLATPPGLFPYQRIGTGPIRGMHDCEGQRLVVSGRMLYRITNAGVGIPLGTVPGVGRVSISHNQFKGGNQVLVCNGAPGGGYVYDTRAQTFERITDPGFPGSLQTAYIDSYLLGVEPFGRFWFHSNLADATDYNTLDRYEAEAAPDRIVGLAVSQFEVIVFGERTAEFYGNAGGATGTFQSKRAVIDRGCASRHTICNLDNSVFWLGDDGIVYRLEGYAARRVSTVPLERAIAGNRWADAFAFTWEDGGHKVYYLTFPDGQTWGFDVVSSLWHRRESYGLNRWRLNDVVRWGNAWYGGDMQDGRIWRLDWDYPAEGDQPMVSERTSPVYADDQSAIIVPSVELLFGGSQKGAVEVGGEFPAQPEFPTISGNAPDATVGVAYEYEYDVSGGAPPYSYSLSSGTVPEGLVLGKLLPRIIGSPVTLGTRPFTARVTDSVGMWSEVNDSIAVTPLWIGVGAITGGASGRYAIGTLNGDNWQNPARATGITGGAYAYVSGNADHIVMFPASGTGVVSEDGGITWSSVTFPHNDSRNDAISVDGVVFISCNTGKIIRKAPGEAPTGHAVTTTGGQGNIYTICQHGAKLVAVSSRATISTDGGLTWSAMGSNYVFPADVAARNIASDGTTMLVVGDSNRMATSLDGTTWAPVTSPFTGTGANRLCAWTNGRWVVVAQDGRVATGTSPWNLQQIPTALPGVPRLLHASNGRFILCNQSVNLHVSNDGVNWQTRTGPFTSLVWAASLERK